MDDGGRVTRATNRAAASRATARGGVVALVLLVGFYVLVALLIASMVALNVGIGVFTGRISPPLVFATLAASFGLLRAVLHVGAPPELNGVEVTAEEEPELWALVDEIADHLDTPAANRLVLGADLNAGVTEQARLLGLIGGPRTVTIGVPLLDTLDHEELRAVLAHEFGHLAGGHGRLGNVQGRTHASIVLAAARTGSLFSRILGWYFSLFLRVTMRTSRENELWADRLAADLVGPEAAARALMGTSTGSVLLENYLHGVVVPVLVEGRQFPGAYSLFPDYVRARRGTVITPEVWAALASNDEQDRYDSHPPTAERLRALGFGPDNPVPRLPVVNRPAAALLREGEAIRCRLADQLAEAASLDPRTAPVVEDTQLGELICGRSDRQAADWLARQTAGAVGAADPQPLGRTLQVLHESGPTPLLTLHREDGEDGDDPDRPGPDRPRPDQAHQPPNLAPDVIEDALRASLRSALTTMLPGHGYRLEPATFKILVTTPDGEIDMAAVARQVMAVPGRIAPLVPALADGGLLWRWPIEAPTEAGPPERIEHFLAIAANGRSLVLVMGTDRSMVLVPTGLTTRERKALQRHKGAARIHAMLSDLDGGLLRDVTAQHEGTVVLPLADLAATLRVPSRLSSNDQGQWRLVLTGPDGGYELDGRGCPSPNSKEMQAALEAMGVTLTITNLKGTKQHSTIS